jgi:hypothetical protein
VKTIADANSLTEHFNKYPDIPAVIPSDAVHIPHDAIYLNHADSIDQFVHAYHQGLDHLVLVDPGLSNIGTAEHAESALDAEMGNVDIQWPMITTILSTKRELELHYKGYTTFNKSLENISWDVLGTGGGAAIGAKIGAALGFLIGGPPGAAVGAALGSVAGGVGGRMITNQAKLSDFKKLKEKYETIGRNLSSNFKKIKTTTETKIDNQILVKQKELKNYAIELETKIVKEGQISKRSLLQKSSINIEHF